MTYSLDSPFPSTSGSNPSLNHEELHASFPLHATLLFTQSIELIFKPNLTSSPLNSTLRLGIICLERLVSYLVVLNT